LFNCLIVPIFILFVRLPRGDGTPSLLFTSFETDSLKLQMEKRQQQEIMTNRTTEKNDKENNKGKKKILFYWFTLWQLKMFLSLCKKM